MVIAKSSTISVNIDDSILIAISKLNIFLETIESGLQSLIRGLLKVEYRIGAAVTTELGSRDVDYILRSLVHELHKDTEIEKLINAVLVEASNLRATRNILIHNNVKTNASKKIISWWRTTSKGKLNHTLSTRTYDDLEELNKEAQILVGDILLIHKQLGIIW